MADFGSYTVTSQIYSTLTILDDKLQIVPYAAEKWTVSRDGLTWTFKLRTTSCSTTGARRMPTT